MSLHVKDLTALDVEAIEGLMPHKTLPNSVVTALVDPENAPLAARLAVRGNLISSYQDTQEILRRLQHD